MPGPSKRPTEQLKLLGSRHAEGRDDEIKPLAGDPDYEPEFLEEKELIEWSDLYPKLLRLGIVTENDMRVLERYCVSFVLWRKLVRLPMEEIKLTDIDRLESQLLRYENHLGLTPSSRASLKIENPNKDESLLGKYKKPKGHKAKTG